MLGLKQAKMHVILQNFRCYTNKTFTFPENNLIKISGPSGIGKSTIFQAIYWCLYKKIQGIYDIRLEKKPTCVVSIIFESRGLTITRQSNPGHLKINYCNKAEISGDVAEAFILEHFGQPDLWHSSCYIEQKMLCSFISSSNRDKLLLLNQLSFHGRNAQEFIQQIEHKVKELHKILEEKQAQLKVYTELYQGKLDVKTFKPDYAQYTVDQVIGYEKYLDDLELQVISQRQKLDLELQKIGKKESLQNQLQHAKENINNNFQEADINTIQTTIEQKITILSEYQRMQPLNQQYRTILAKIAQLVILPELLEMVITPDTISQVNNHHKMHVEQYLPLLNELNNLVLPANYQKVLAGGLVTQDAVNLAFQQADQYQRYLTLSAAKENIYQAYLALSNATSETWQSHISGFTWTQEIAQKSVTHLATYREQYLPLAAKFEAIILPDSLINYSGQVDQNLIITAKQAEQKYQEYLTSLEKLNNIETQVLQQGSEQGSVNIPDWTFTEQNQLIKTVQEYAQYLQLKKQLQDALQKLHEVPGLELQSLNTKQGLYVDQNSNVITLANYYHYQTILHKWQTEHDLAMKYVNCYDKGEIEKRLCQIAKYINYLKQKTMLTNYINLKSKYHELNDIASEIDELQKALQDIQMAQLILTCPSCQSQVQMQSGQLIIYRKLSKITLNNKQELQNKLSELQQLQQLTLSVTLSENELLEAKDVYSKQLDLNTLLNEQKILSSFIYPDQIANLPYELLANINDLQGKLVEVAEPKYSVEQGNLFLTYNQIKQQIASYPTAAISPTSQELQILFEYQQLENQIEHLVQNNYNREPRILPDMINKYIEYQALDAQCQNLHDKPLEFTGQELSIIKSQQEKSKRLSELEQYKNDVIYPASELQKAYEYQQLIKERDNLHGATDIDYQDDIKQLQEEIDSLRRKLSEVEKEQAKQEQLKLDIIRITTEIEQIVLDDTLQQTCQESEKTLKDGRATLTEIKYAKEMYDYYLKMTELNQQLHETQQDYAACQDLIRDAKDVEIKHLSRTVDKINHILHELFREMFADQILVKLQLTKENKSGDVKREVNLSIKYKGAQYTKYQSLSGGEKDRVSAGLIIALNMMSDSPILILDECLTGIEYQYREAFMDAIKKFLANKTVMIISHEDLGGWYDYTLDLTPDT